MITNYGADSLFSVPVSFSINGVVIQSQTWTGILPPLDSVEVSFSQVGLSIGENTLCVSTTLTGDGNSLNNERCISSWYVPTLPIPFFDDFESAGGWYPDTVSNQWERGIPAGVHISTAHSPANVWMTKLNSIYANNSNDYLYSPRFSLASAQPDSLIFWHYFESETYADFCKVEYLDTWGVWNTLGIKDDTNGVNWYNTNMMGSTGWTNSSLGWIRSSYDLSKVQGLGAVTQFRFHLSSNGVNNFYDGWAIDDFQITELINTDDVGISEIVHPGSATIAGEQITVEVKIMNFGAGVQSYIPVSFAINGLVAANEVWTGALSSGDSVTWAFTTQYTAPSQGYTLCAQTSLGNDQNTANDSLCYPVLINSTGIYPTDGFSIGQNIPNPANGLTRFCFNLPETNNYQLTIRDMLGNILAERKGQGQCGANTVELDVRTIPAGVYSYTLEFDRQKITRMMVITH